MLINRLIIPSNKDCLNGCLYCFAQRLDYQKPRLEQQLIENAINIVYPQCDGELEIDEHLHELCNNKLLSATTKIVIAYSTKNVLASNTMQTLAKINQAMTEDDVGFIKIAVAITTKTQQVVIEPMTSAYTKRIDTLKYIHESGLHVALTIKPILPFISVEEYCEILSDAHYYTDKVLIGGLYVDLNSLFYQKHLIGYPLTKRKVSWLPENPIWDYTGSEDKELLIKRYAQKNGITVFDSDIDLVKQIGIEKRWGQYL